MRRPPEQDVFGAVVFAAAVFVAVAAMAGLTAVPGWAQEDPPESREESAEDSGLETSETDLAAIESLLLQDESAMVDPESSSSDPETRRDPFRSLVETREAPAETTSERPEGRAGLLIDEILVEGVFELPDGPVAQVQSAREETSYLLRPGDQLWDGDVISITLREVVFKQVVDDPTALKPFREVVKRLNP